MVMKMDEGLDTGAIAMAERVADRRRMQRPATCMTSWRGSARKLMLVALGALERGSLIVTPQAADGATYADKIDKNETRIDWRTAVEQTVHDHCRGLSPFPGAWFELAGVGRVKVLRTTRGERRGRAGPRARRAV